MQNSILELEKCMETNIKEKLSECYKMKEKLTLNMQLYYDKAKDERDKEEYYKTIQKRQTSGEKLFSAYHKLITTTHKNKIPYFLSKDHYLYTWVDLRPDGTVKSIYSGKQKDPQTLILEDFEIIKKRHEKFQALLSHPNLFEVEKKMINIETDFKFNTEHIVPQSWYNAREPMKGDLHHLFVCQPECNKTRANFPYDDFSFYVPESPNEKIRNQCGVASDGKFEPEYGKGAVARSMLYFLLRYPNAIKRSFKKKIDIRLLLYWNREFTVSLHEKHRNQAIYQIQGNRNPFIDYPELAEKIRFPL